MKTLGLIGGMSWESTATYYRLLNEHAKAALGGLHSARLEARGIRVLVPEADDRATVHRIIYDELCLGDIRPTSRTAYLDIIGRLAAAGAQGVVLGCTEIPLLVSAGDTSLPLFDTTALHARFAADFALG